MRLDVFLAEASRFCEVLPAGQIRSQLEKFPTAIATRDFACGLRIGRSGKVFRSFLTNGLEDKKEFDRLNRADIDL